MALTDAFFAAPFFTARFSSGSFLVAPFFAALLVAGRFASQPSRPSPRDIAPTAPFPSPPASFHPPHSSALAHPRQQPAAPAASAVPCHPPPARVDSHSAAAEMINAVEKGQSSWALRNLKRQDALGATIRYQLTSKQHSISPLNGSAGVFQQHRSLPHHLLRRIRLALHARFKVSALSLQKTPGRHPSARPSDPCPPSACSSAPPPSMSLFWLP